MSRCVYPASVFCIARKLVFVIVSDHTANSSGRDNITVSEYRVPLFLYSTGRISPGRIDTLCSQIDVAPTVMGLLGLPYRSRFFGEDILKMDRTRGRALLSNYHGLGLYRDDRLTILDLQKSVEGFSVNPTIFDQTRIEVSDADLLDTLGYYQTASAIMKSKQLANLSAHTQKGDRR